MDREVLQPLVGKRRQKFTGVFIRTGFKHSKSEPTTSTILLRDVKLDGEVTVTNHLWLDYTKDLAKLGMLWPGDVIQFTATVVEYPHAGSKSAIGDMFVTDDFYMEYGVQRAMKFKKIATPNIPDEEMEVPDFEAIRQSPNFDEELANVLRWYSYQLSIRDFTGLIPPADIDEEQEPDHTNY